MKEYDTVCELPAIPKAPPPKHRLHDRGFKRKWRMRFFLETPSEEVIHPYSRGKTLHADSCVRSMQKKAHCIFHQLMVNLNKKNKSWRGGSF
ncbi:hypothetical protein M1I95_06950 [Rossellomorea marisflavi]|uniref:hypothetical protein n=1 Tax=Rossellomorea marisflavi TaxID=189381 RepID=UPI0027A80936|nr:hypothetical protein [Rossellomorea marisflavi]UTE74197.1 hypothetical protein M1I95_06950 [Rossellomorea marisflavi]